MRHEDAAAAPVEMSQTGYCIRMQTSEGAPYWQTSNESSKDQEPAMDVGEPVTLLPGQFQLGTAIVVMEPDSPVADPEAAGLVGDSGDPDNPRYSRYSPHCRRCERCEQWRAKWQATVMAMGEDPRRRAPIAGEMYSRRELNEPPRWVLAVEDAYQIGTTWVRFSLRAGVTNERELGQERVGLSEWERWVRDGGELIGFLPIEAMGREGGMESRLVK